MSNINTYPHYFTTECPEEVSRKHEMVELMSYGAAYLDDHSGWRFGHGRYKVPIELMPETDDDDEEYCNFDWDKYLVGFDYYENIDSPHGNIIEIWFSASDAQLFNF